MTLKFRDIWDMNREKTIHNVTRAYVSDDGYKWTVYTKTSTGVEDFNTYSGLELREMF